MLDSVLGAERLARAGHIRLEHVATETNVANWLTKVLPGTAFVKERDRVMTTRLRAMKPPSN